MSETDWPQGPGFEQPAAHPGEPTITRAPATERELDVRQPDTLEVIEAEPARVVELKPVAEPTEATELDRKLVTELIRSYRVAGVLAMLVDCTRELALEAKHEARTGWTKVHRILANAHARAGVFEPKE